MDLSADLPAPRDDEPASLRQDIVDELSDHLQCAVDRERQRAALEGEDVASLPEYNLWQRAVARFGEPAQLVRQLWWDAMKEKIMSQRTQTASLVIMAVLVLGMFILTWMSLADSRRLAQDNQQLNRDLLAQMQLLADRPDPAPVVQPAAVNSPAEWNELKFQCVWGNESGEPAEGVRILLESDSDNTSGIPPGAETSGADGIVDFGKVLYGTYSATVHSPNHLTERISVSVRPGQDKTVTVVCPEGAGTQSVTLETPFDWSIFPESIRERTWILCAIQADGITHGQGYSRWDTEHGYEWDGLMSEDREGLVSGFGYGPGLGTFLINAAGEILPANKLQVEESQVDAEWTKESRLSRVASMMYELPETPLFVDSIAIPVGGYYMSARIAVVDPLDATGRRLLVIQDLPMSSGGGGYGGGPMAGGYTEYGGSPMGGAEEMARMMGGRSSRGSRGQFGSDVIQIPVGRLPFGYLTNMAESSMSTESYGAGGMFPMGGPSGRGGQAEYIVDWDEPATWDIIPAETGSIRLAELALRTPVGMEVIPVLARVTTGAEDGPRADAPIDIVWKGLLADADGNVNLEEHVLLTGVDLLTTGGSPGEEGEETFHEFFVSITPEEAAVFLEESIALGLWVRASTEPVRESASDSIDDELFDRLKQNSAQYHDVPADVPQGMRVVSIDIQRELLESTFRELRPGSLCDIYLSVAQEPGEDARLLRLLDHRLVLRMGGFSADGPQTVHVIVGAEEADLMSQVLDSELGAIIPFPVYQRGDFNPLEKLPNLDEVSRQLEALRTHGGDI